MPSRRVPRTSGGRFAAHSPAETSRRTASSRRSDDNSKTTANNTNTTTGGEDNGMFQDERPAKKRRLEIRAGPKQQTLDSLGFFNRAAAAAAAQQSPVQPPNKVTIAEPHGQLIETVNGVRTELSTGEEDAFGEEKEGVDTPSKAAPAPPNAAPAAQPVEKRKKEERRSLRSRDEGPRLKSELAAYFGNFEGIMFGAPAEPDFITVDSAIYITDDAQKAAKAETPSPSKTSKQTKGSPNSARVNGKQENSTGQAPPNTNNYNGCQSLDLSTFTKVVSDKAHDPLSEEHFLKSHKRAERKEKQLRNIERERAMHEKVQLDRLLDGLQGHDWLRVLGVTGITDGEARKYEPKRDYFIAEVQALVDKFKEWKDEERRQRLEREAALAAEREAEEDEDDDSASLSSSDLSIEPPSSDLNASAARQLQQETASALKSSTSKQLLHPQNTPSTHPKPQTRTTPLPPPEPIPYRPPSPITSFYSKRHLRDAALGKTRQGRSVTAFGHAVPELEEREFELPPEYVTEEVLKARGREWRRRRREGRGKNDGG